MHKRNHPLRRLHRRRQLSGMHPERITLAIVTKTLVFVVSQSTEWSIRVTITRTKWVVYTRKNHTERIPMEREIEPISFRD
jgi:hypothetical protein